MQLLSPYDGGAPPPSSRWFCSLHGKQRNQQSLCEDGLGGYRCVQSMECKTSVTGTTCSVHGKLRGVESLVDDGLGGFRCIAGKECKDGLAIKRELCKFWLQGICNKGIACTFLHGADDKGGPSGLESEDGTMTMGQGPGFSMPNGMVLGSEAHQQHMRTRQEAAFNVGMVPTAWNGFEVMMFPKGEHAGKQAKGAGRCGGVSPGSSSGTAPSAQSKAAVADLPTAAAAFTSGMFKIGKSGGIDLMSAVPPPRPSPMSPFGPGGPLRAGPY